MAVPCGRYVRQALFRFTSWELNFSPFLLRKAGVSSLARTMSLTRFDGTQCRLITCYFWTRNLRRGRHLLHPLRGDIIIHSTLLGLAARQERCLNPSSFSFRLVTKHRSSRRTVRNDCVGLILLLIPDVFAQYCSRMFWNFFILLKLCGRIKLNLGSTKQPHDDALQEVLKGQKEITEKL